MTMSLKNLMWKVGAGLQCWMEARSSSWPVLKHVHLVTEWREEDEDPAKAELWEADWDDTSISDNFSQQLQAELQKHSKK